MGDDVSEAELADRVNKALEAYALKKGAKSHIWICVTEDNGPVGGCSPNLRPYGPGLMDEVEKATGKRIVVTDGALQPNLLTAEQVFNAAAKTKHVEIHPIVALLINGMNELNNHKIPRINALTDPSTVPEWFPFSADKYAARAQKMDLPELFKVMDVVFAAIRGDLPKIKKLHTMLENVFKSGCCSIGTRAAVDAFFDFLTQDAMQPVVTEALSGLFRKRLQSELENGSGVQEKRRRANAEGGPGDMVRTQAEPESDESPEDRRQWSGPSDTSSLSFLWPFEDSLQSPALVQRATR